MFDARRGRPLVARRDPPGSAGRRRTDLRTWREAFAPASAVARAAQATTHRRRRRSGASSGRSRVRRRACSSCRPRNGSRPCRDRPSRARPNERSTSTAGGTRVACNRRWTWPHGGKRQAHQVRSDLLRTLRPCIVSGLFGATRYAKLTRGHQIFAFAPLNGMVSDTRHQHWPARVA